MNAFLADSGVNPTPATDNPAYAGDLVASTDQPVSDPSFQPELADTPNPTTSIPWWGFVLAGVAALFVLDEGDHR